MLHLLVTPVSQGGYSLRDCDDVAVYNTLEDIVSKSPMCKGFQMAGKIAPGTKKNITYKG